ncbi:hypothetical protein BI364_12415 [Acidihalobacter yilgarnensis]|uniref:Methyltransferase domain-containing protein n=1 Tax=Acidihalobacter yilgarnensis TaxID=2819280 RepID=A0A1D8IQE9_9GAMM|nr:class I SAM-dependent methyltransferase [Acidihalobacter yilgarnensis]AOU98655.1 hypothetical protein BI364_12415 [Acidihalobacter yilgarnensis]
MCVLHISVENEAGGVPVNRTESGLGDEAVTLRADRFLEAAIKHIAPLKGTHIYDAKLLDYQQKTSSPESGYGRWLQALLTHLKRFYISGHRLKILDFGCGTGELTVMMNHLGFDATGIDLHTEHLGLARILANENGLPESIFVQSHGPKLPFDDNSFDVVTMFVVLEHLNDEVLDVILTELRRVCHGVLYVLVPNKLQIRDDHTGLRFLPWMPRWLALLYLKTRGRRHQYCISEDGSWDVYYRGLRRIRKLFAVKGFEMDFIADEWVFPSLEKVPPITLIGKRIKIQGRWVPIGIPLPYRTLLRWGFPKQVFYPYLNLVFVRR